MAKRLLRRQARATLRSIAPAQCLAASAQARARLAQQAVWQSARAILFYAPMAGELDVWPLLVQALAAGKTVALPRYATARGSYLACVVEDLTAEVEVGRFGIREPVADCERRRLKRLDLILVPGLAFDGMGRRLGRGKGFYDHLLAQVQGATCGVGFDEQVVEAVPVESHDIRLNYLLTPTRWHEIRTGEE